MAHYDFNGRVALVTGGGSGIGRATCLQLARNGARVLVTDVNLEAARHTLSLLPGGGEHLALQMDVTRQSDVEGVIATAKDKFGAPPSLLVNSAGFAQPVPFVDLAKEKLDAMFDVNLKGTFIVSQVFTRALLDDGQEPREGRGAVVNISSISAKTGFVLFSDYTATKGAVTSLTKSCAAELACKGIRVNCVLPGIIDTPLIKIHSERLKKIGFPLGRLGKPEGGGSGIGRATSQQLARDGARVLVTDVNLEGARHTLSLLSGGAEHLALQMDVRKQSDVEEVIAAAKDKFGAPPSLLVNCAGIAEYAHFVDVTNEELDEVIDINLKGTFIVSQVFTRALLDEGQAAREGRGAVVNIASILGKTGLPRLSHYAATKGAVISLTKTCAAELASKGIRVNCVLPGLIDTPMAPTNLEELSCMTRILGRIGKPEEVAEVTAFLLSERSSYMVGACVEVAGGFGM